MKLRAAFLTLTVGLTAWTSSLAAPKPKLIVAILVDQLRYDYMERFHDEFVEDGFRLLTDKGAFMAFARYNYFPTITGPGHASFLSGAPPAMHGIIANDWFDKRTRKMMYCCQDDSVTPVGTETGAGKMSPRNFIGSNFADQLRLHYRSKVVGVSMKDRGAILPAGKQPLGAYWFESTSGNFITSSYYHQELPDWVKKFNDRKQPASYTGKTWSRLLDVKHYQWPDQAAGEGSMPGEKAPVFDHKIAESPHLGYETIMPTPFGNELLRDFAIAAIEGEQLGQGPNPDLLTVSFSCIDYCGHRFGPYSQEVQDIVYRLDRQLQEFFTYLDKQFGLENVVITMTADHGVAPTPEFAKEQGLDASRADGFALVTDLVNKITERYGPGQYFLTNSGKLSPRIYEGNLYLDYNTLAEKQIPVSDFVSFIREWALSTGFFHAVYGREQLLDGRAPGPIGQRVINGYNAERSGDVVLILKPFAVPSGGGAKTGTTHGSPYSYDTHIPIMLYGAPFIAGRYYDDFTITDIVPTLCAALHIDQPAASIGTPLVKALRDQAGNTPPPAPSKPTPSKGKR